MTKINYEIIKFMLRKGVSLNFFHDVEVKNFFSLCLGLEQFGATDQRNTTVRIFFSSINDSYSKSTKIIFSLYLDETTDRNARNIFNIAGMPLTRKTLRFIFWSLLRSIKQTEKML